MAEEEKKPNEDANTEKLPGKDADGNGGDEEAEKKEGEKAAPPPPTPPPPEEVVMKVDMHCEGCARKVRRSLRGFPGVEEVVTDSRTHSVVVKGRKAAEDPMKVVVRVQKKSGRKVELLSPLTPLPPPPPEKEEEKPKVEEEEELEVIIVVLRVYMHCDACVLEIKKRILRMKGVQSAEPDLRRSEVTVKGVFDPANLAAYVLKRTGKQAAVVKREPAEKKPEKAKAEEPPATAEPAKDEKKPDEGGNKEVEKKEDEAKKKADDGGGGSGGEGEKDDGTFARAEEKRNEMEKKAEEGGTTAAAVEAASPAAAGGGGGGGGGGAKKMRNEFYSYYPRYPVEYAYPPQIFSDENPNACAVM